MEGKDVDEEEPQWPQPELREQYEKTLAQVRFAWPPRTRHAEETPVRHLFLRTKRASIN